MNKTIHGSILIVLLCCMLITLLAGCGSGEKGPVSYRAPGIPKGSVKDTAESEEENTEGDAEADAELLNVYILEILDKKDSTLTVQNVMTGQEFRYDYSLGTSFLDKYDDHTPISDFKSGMIVEIGEQLDSGAVSFVKQTDKVWEYDGVKNFIIDTEKNVMTIDGSNYVLQAYVPFYSGKTLIDPKEISDDDVLRVYGAGKEILSVSIASGHGYLALVNTALFENSLIQIGKVEIALIKGEMSLEVPEGKHAVTVANKGYGGTKKVRIKRGKTTTLDLNELKGEGPKSCELTFKVEAEGAVIYLDGAKVKAGKKLIVPYGAHSIRIEMEGYETWERTLYVNSAKAEISLDPTEGTSARKNNTQTQTNVTSGGGTSTGGAAGSRSDDDDRDQTELDYLTTLSDSLANLVSD